jgi:hypothetical protein
MLKFLAKLAANKIQKIITRTIHENQYGFIKERTIQDCLAWSFEFMYQCQKSLRIFLLKIDFKKAKTP